jgi:hypothetical protein
MSIAPDIIEQVQADFPPEAVANVLAQLESASSTARIQRCIVFAARGHPWYFAYLCRHTQTDYRDVIIAAEYVLSDVRLYDFTRPFHSARIDDPYLPRSSSSVSSVPCCKSLEDYMNASEHSPLHRLHGTGPLTLTVHWDESTRRPMSWSPEAAVFFCPFCGTRLQTEESVAEWSPPKREDPDDVA